MICRQPRSMIGNDCVAQPSHAFVDVRDERNVTVIVPMAHV